MFGDWWEQLRDWWESDSHFRQMIVLAVIVGSIHLVFTLLEIRAQQWAQSNAS